MDAAQKFLEGHDIISAFVPVDMQSAANNGDWVSMKNYDSCVIVLFKAAGTAGDDPVFTVKQATDNAGTGAKALNFTVINTKVGTLTGIGTWTRNTQSAANTYTDAVSAEAQAIMVVEISADDLDVSNSFNHIQLSIPDIGTNAQLGCGLYIMRNGAYRRRTPISAL